MGWKQNLMGEINTAISRGRDATIVVHSVEQKEWGERMVENIFSTLYLIKPVKIDFEIKNDENLKAGCPVCLQEVMIYRNEGKIKIENHNYRDSELQCPGSGEIVD